MNDTWSRNSPGLGSRGRSAELSWAETQCWWIPLDGGALGGEKTLAIHRALIESGEYPNTHFEY